MKIRNFFLTGSMTITWICLLIYIMFPAQINADDTREAQAEIRSGEITAKAHGHRPGWTDADYAVERTSEAAETAAMVQAAWQQGPEAVIALGETLRGNALDAAMDDIDRAHEMLSDKNSSLSRSTGSLITEAQAALLDPVPHQPAALSPDEGVVRSTVVQESVIAGDSPGATLTVGSGCTYASVTAALAAASDGDTILLAGGVTFTENLAINRNIVLRGGYDGCSSGSSLKTTLDGGNSGTVVNIAAGLTVTLENLIITNGNSGFEGGGIQFALGTGTGELTLTNVDIHHNQAYWGGGLWVGPQAVVTGDNVDIYENGATSIGGGIRLYGGQAFFYNSNIYLNTAPLGGGVAGRRAGDTDAAELYLVSSADVYDNESLTGVGYGGGVYLENSIISISDCSDIYFNDAIAGGGVYMVSSSLTIDGSCSEIQNNTATGDGGGVYAVDGSVVNLDDKAEVYHNTSGGNGGGLYLDTSTLWSDKADIQYNEAGGYGGGVYAGNNSLVDMDLGTYACVDHRCSMLRSNEAGVYGGGVYAADSDVDLIQTYVENNSAVLGGGVYASAGDGNALVSLANVVVARNNAESGTDGIRLYSGAVMTGNHLTIAYNDTGGAATGVGIASFNSTLTLLNSIIWGHATSIDTAGHTVTFSDIQGGYTGSNNLNVDPGFVSPAGQDYRLQLSSAVLDRHASGGSRDVENDHRPYAHVRPATPYDMGADEYVPDIDNDGLSDNFELTVSCTDAAIADTDDDGILDGVEDKDGDGTVDLGETDPCDADTDDDGILDGYEDLNDNGLLDKGETNPLNADTDGDGIQDGTETGVAAAHADTGPGFQPDLDPASTTDPRKWDTDGDGRSDGEEDRNHNGRVDIGESDPTVIDDIPTTLPIPILQLLLLAD